MPRYLAPKDYTRLSKTVSKIYQYATNKLIPVDQGHVPLLGAELLPLLHAVDFSSCSTFYDPSDNSGTMGKCMHSAKCKAVETISQLALVTASQLTPGHRSKISEGPRQLLDAFAISKLARHNNPTACRTRNDLMHPSSHDNASCLNKLSGIIRLPLKGLFC
jgi:hypothetical protein